MTRPDPYRARRESSTPAPATSPPPPALRPVPEASDVIWCDPPGGRGSPHMDLSQRLEPLRERPGVWARVAVYDIASTASNQVAKLRKQHPDYEFTGRRIDNVPGKRSAMWARYRAL